MNFAPCIPHDVRKVRPAMAATPRWLVHGLIDNTATILSGEPKAGKTALVSTLVKAVADCEPTWMNGSVNTHGPVVIIAGDDGEFLTWPERVGVDTTWPVYVLDPGNVPLSDTRGWAATVASILAVRPALVVIDNATDLAGDLDINAAPTVARMKSTITSPLVRGGASVVMLAHSKRRDFKGPASMEPMGAQAWKAMYRQTVGIAPKADGTRIVRTSGNFGQRRELIVALRFGEGLLATAEVVSDRVSEKTPGTVEEIASSIHPLHAEANKTAERKRILAWAAEAKPAKLDDFLSVLSVSSKGRVQEKLKRTAGLRFDTADKALKDD